MAGISDYKAALEAGGKIARSAWECNMWVELFIPPPIQKFNPNDPTNPIIEESTPDEYYLVLNTSELEVQTPSIYVGISRYYPGYLDVSANDWEIIP